MTETFFAAQMGYRFMALGRRPSVRTRKRLPRRASGDRGQFRAPPLCFFEGTDVRRTPVRPSGDAHQPTKASSSPFSPEAGPGINVQPVMMEFDYGSSFMTSPPELRALLPT
jgi:hypothetical protein